MSELRDAKSFYGSASGGIGFAMGGVIGMDLRKPDLDFIGMARSMGVNAQHITRAEDISPAVQAGMNASGPTLLDVRVADGYGG